jgi:hypothetical protein
LIRLSELLLETSNVELAAALEVSGDELDEISEYVKDCAVEISGNEVDRTTLGNGFEETATEYEITVE